MELQEKRLTQGKGNKMKFKKIRENTIAIILLVSAIVWILATILEPMMVEDKMSQNMNFLDLLIFNIPEMLIYHRILYILIISFLFSMVFLYRTQYKLKSSENTLNELNKTLEQKVIDRTEALTNANLKLEHLSKSKSDILSLISHELKTPLNGIMGLANILLTELENTNNKEIAQHLFDSAKRLNKFSETALMVTKLKLREHNLSPVKINLDDFVNNVTIHFNELDGSNILNISKNFIAENIYVEIDENLIAFSIESILNNAIKFSDKGSEIKVILTIEGNYFILCFQDKGNGFSEEVLPQIFELFTVNDILHHTEGLGLSLAIVGLIMEYHNGKVEAKNIESGAEVSMYLPLKIE
ncbi:MAG: hypothetical protein HW421_1536 [Ignavibacteria bacterium]|nr:hypothetical protein [Ignavibacteria bacterium]